MGKRRGKGDSGRGKGDSILFPLEKYAVPFSVPWGANAEDTRSLSTKRVAGCSGRMELAKTRKVKTMSLSEVVIEGTLKPDGTLELDQKPSLSPGRVTVVLRQESESSPPNEDWFQHLQRIGAEREASGYPFMNEAEANAHIEWLREGDRVDEMLREVDEQRQKAGQP